VTYRSLSYISPVLEPLNVLYHETHDCSQV